MIWPARADLPPIGPSGIGLIVDVIDADRGPLFEKRLSGRPERFELDGRPTVWTAQPHPLVLLDEQSNPVDPGSPSVR